MTVPVRFLHCADLHLGSRFVGISDSDPGLAQRMMSASYDALENIVDIANRSAVDFVIFAGDVFDTSSETPYARARFADALSRISAPCYIAYGNHDFARKWEDSIPLPKNAFVFGHEMTTFMFPNEGEPVAALHGFSYRSRQTDSRIKEFSGIPGVLNIGVMHTDLDGPPDSPYAPCRSSDLSGKGIDYWALGHIHKGGIVCEDPVAVYPGTPQGRNSKESGPKGAYLVQCGESGINPEFVRTSAIEWTDVDVSIGPDTDLTALVADVKERSVPGSILRITVTGSGPLNSALRTDRADILELMEKDTGCVCSDFIVRTRPSFDLEARSKAGDFTAAVLEYGTGLSATLSRESIIDRICTTTASATIRPLLERMSSDELRELVDDSIAYIVERMLEAEDQ